MHDSAKYLVHADITASGVVERSDVVGAVFGQTEGLLGDELDLRELQDSQKIGRIDVEITSESGVSTGELTIASGLDRVETAILAAALESIERVGPCRATVEVRELEDVRSAKRREVVERAKELLERFDETVMTSEELVEEVRRSRRVEQITEYSGLPAGPRVADSDAIVVVEGRADVSTLLEYGIKNAVAVEGTDVPEAVADLTRERTVTAFLDGDRGGDLILRELAQVGDVDYVAIAPADRSVEDLSRTEVLSALREKVRFDTVAEGGRIDLDGPEESPDTETGADPEPDDDGSDALAASTDGAGAEPSDATGGADQPVSPASQPDAQAGSTDGGAVTTTDDAGPRDAAASDDANGDEGARSDDDETRPPDTLSGHVAAVFDGESARVRFLDAEFGVLDDRSVDEAFDALEAADEVPETVLLDGELTQRILDIAAQRGVEQIVCRSQGAFVKRPIGVRIREASALRADQ